MGLETALVVAALAATAGSTVYQVQESRRAGKEASDEKDRQVVKQAKLEQEAKDRAAQEESDLAASQSRDQARLRQRALAAGYSGRRGTIQTGSLGVQGTPSTASKTLLGT